MSNGSIHWYAIYTKSNFEKKVYQKLQEISVEAYLPLHKKLRVWSDRKKWIEEPLMRSYLFVKIDRKDYFNILNITGVVRFITFSGEPVTIPDSQIETLRKLLSTGADLEISSEVFNPGDPVEISAGNLLGMGGELIEYKGSKKVIIRIDHIEHSLLVNIPVEYLQRSKTAAVK